MTTPVPWSMLKYSPDFRSGVDVDSRGRVGHFGDQTRQDRYAEPMQRMGQPVVGHGRQRRVAQDYLLETRRGGIAVENGLDVGAEPAAQFGQLLQQQPGGLGPEPFGVDGSVAVEGFVGPGALAGYNLGEFAQQDLDGLRAEVPRKDHRAEVFDGLFEFRGVDARPDGGRNMGVGGGQPVGKLPQPRGL